MMKEDNNNRINFEQANFDGKRPLHEAAQAGQLECVKYLLEQNVKVDSLKRADWTPLMLACAKNNFAVIKALINAGADPSLQNKDGWNSFHLACREGHPEIVNYLLDLNKGLWKTVSKNGRTPLHTASLHKRLETVEILLTRTEIDKDAQDNCGSTAFMDAARSGNKELLSLLHKKFNVSYNLIF